MKHTKCVNKDLKAAVIRPTILYLHKTTLFFNHQITKLVYQLFPEQNRKCTHSNTIIDHTKKASQRQRNVLKMSSEIRKYQILATDIQQNRGLLNVFCATPEQSHDMLTFIK